MLKTFFVKLYNLAIYVQRIAKEREVFVLERITLWKAFNRTTRLHRGITLRQVSIIFIVGSLPCSTRSQKLRNWGYSILIKICAYQVDVNFDVDRRTFPNSRSKYTWSGALAFYRNEGEAGITH